jgi:hypothetical protein
MVEIRELGAHSYLRHGGKKVPGFRKKILEGKIIFSLRYVNCPTIKEE